jgi:hypothetical protein
MKFKIDVSVATNPILDYKRPVLAIGSCFADRIAAKLDDCHFSVLNNPNGILYNPISIASTLIGEKVEGQIQEYNGLWHSMQHHGQFSNIDKAALLESIEFSRHSVRQRLSEPKTTILITLGTSNVFTFNGVTVANCHKMPAKIFERKRLSVEEIVQKWQSVISMYSQHDFIFTVSPVRYIRDGIHESNISKSVLHVSVEQLVTKFSNAHYFPAYEIVIDELRDYRFFEEDLVHPNDMAVNYVWEALQSSHFTEKTKEMALDWKNVNQMRQHKVLHPLREEAIKFTLKLNKAEADFMQKNGLSN